MPDRYVCSRLELGAPKCPRYHFNVIDTGCVTLDDEGLDLPNIHEARKQALAALADMTKDEFPDGDQREFVIEVRDGSPEPILRATLSLNAEKKA